MIQNAGTHSRCWIAAWGARALPSLSPLRALFLLAIALCLTQSQAAQSATTPSGVAAWGNNVYGQLGDGTTRRKALPVTITDQGALKGKTVSQVAAGGSHTLALCSDGTLTAWGNNQLGQLGDAGSASIQSIPVAINSYGALKGKTITQIKAGTNHNLALCSDGTLLAWGGGERGALGTSKTNNGNVPLNITGQGALAGRSVTQIAAGGFNSLALCSDGSVLAWGYNSSGELGDGTHSQRNLPVDVTHSGVLVDKTVVQIALGSTHTLALCSDGTLAAWGDNRYGQVGDGMTANRFKPVNITRRGALLGKTVLTLAPGGIHSVVLCSDGTLVTWGNNASGQLGDGTGANRILPIAVPNQGAIAGKKVQNVVAGYSHTVALCTDGTLASWGNDLSGQLGDGTGTNQFSPVDITEKGVLGDQLVTLLAAGESHTVVVTTVRQTPVPQAPLIIPGSVTNITSSGAKLNAIINPNGAVTTARFEYGITSAYGSQQTVTLSPSDGRSNQDVSAVLSGLAPRTTYHFHAIATNSVGTTTSNDGTFTTTDAIPSGVTPSVAAWGNNGTGQLGDSSTTDKPLPVNITSSGVLAGKTVTRVVAGGSHSFALCSDGTVAAWGWNYSGELGYSRGSLNIITAPVDITSSGVLKGKTVTQIEAGSRYSMALCSDGTIATWGDNSYGELGDGTKVNRPIPVDITRQGVLFGKTVTQICIGDTTSFALCSDGTLAAWGRNPMVGDGTYTDQILPLDISNQGSLNGKTVTQIAGGSLHSVALCSDGTVATWGDNVLGQLGDGTTSPHPRPLAINNKGALKGKTVTRIAVGGFANYAFCSDGSLLAWGSNNYGQLGDGTITQRNAPIDVTGKGDLAGKTITQLVVGDNHSVALCSDGTLAAWGYNLYSTVGDGTTAQRNLPVVITSNGALKDKYVTQISAGNYHTLALTGTKDPTTNQPPSVIITTPTPKQSVTLADFGGNTIGGNASDDTGVTSVTVKLYRTRDGVNQIWNGSAFTTLSRTVAAAVSGQGTSITWKMGSQAPPRNLLDTGEYQVIIYATDAAGLTATTRSTFALVTSPPETEKPVIVISAPTANQMVLINELTVGSIRGVATDNVGVTKVDLKLYRTRGGMNQIWNGTAFTTTSTTVSATLSGSKTSAIWNMGDKTPPQNQLDAGVYQLIAYATDAAGNTSNTRVTFTLYTSGTTG